MSANTPKPNWVVDAKTQSKPLCECVSHAVEAYFEHLNGTPTAHLYAMLLAEVEVPLLRVTLERAQGNQSRAAEWLGISRGTLRKKLKQYRL